MKMKCLIIALLLIGLELRSQRPTSFLEVRFEVPNLNYTPLIDWENYQFMARDVPIDSKHFLRVGVPIERSQVVYVHYMDTTNRTYIHRFFLPKGDTLKGHEIKGKFGFEGKNKAATINRFLYQQGVFGGDSLMQRPLMQKVSTDIYTKLMQDLAEESWERYKSTQDTSDTGQNAFVRAALEAQYYQRTKFFVATKNWTDAMFEEYHKGSEPSFASSEVYHPPLRILPFEDAMLSLDYQQCLLEHIQKGITPQPDLYEVMTEFYNVLDRQLPHLPVTRETLLTSLLMWKRDYPRKYEIVARFERDFPKAKRLKELKNEFWKNQKPISGIPMPSLPLLAVDSNQVFLPTLANTNFSLMLIWNTWEDSCELALTTWATFAQKYTSPDLSFITLGVRNHFDSWKEALKKKQLPSKTGTHLYARHAETEILEGMFGAKRPLVVVMDAQANYVEHFSPFEKEQLDRWLKR
jgi:hypothetical protein